MNDAELDQILRQHPVQLQLSSDLQCAVWSRIEGHEKRWQATRGVVPLLTEWMRSGLVAIGRPAVAVAVIALFAVVGAGIGTAMPKSVNSQRGEWSYLKTVNPLARAHMEVEQ